MPQYHDAVVRTYRYIDTAIMNEHTLAHKLTYVLGNTVTAIPAQYRGPR